MYSVHDIVCAGSYEWCRRAAALLRRGVPDALPPRAGASHAALAAAAAACLPEGRAHTATVLQTQTKAGAETDQ